MNTFDPKTNIRHSPRLKDYDYSSAGAYFVTICTQNRENLFGQINAGAGPGGASPRRGFAEPRRAQGCPIVVISDAGRIVDKVWQQIPVIYSNIAIDEFEIMPNHIHGIIVIDDPLIAQRVLPSGRSHRIAPTPLSLSVVIQRFKSLTTKLCIDGVKQSGWPPFNGKLWQRSYYERVIRNEKEVNNVRQYILDNPLKWESDEENPQAIRFEPLL